MRNRSCIDSIDDYKSVVYLSIYRGRGWTLCTTEFRANFEDLANKHSTKLGTLIYSAHARTVRPTGTDCPASGSDRPRAPFGAKHCTTCAGLVASPLAPSKFDFRIWFCLLLIYTSSI
jgi:hypothetical protein